MHRIQSVWQKTLTLVVGQTEPEIYLFTEGMQGVWTKGSNTSLAFKTNGHFPLFAGLEVDGTTPTQSEHYTAGPGSTSITLLLAYLETLGSGSHIIAARYGDGQEPFTRFSVVSAPEPTPEPRPEPEPKPEPTPQPEPTPAPSPDAEPRHASRTESASAPAPKASPARKPLPDTRDHALWWFSLP